jgi:hypothetical protein
MCIVRSLWVKLLEVRRASTAAIYNSVRTVKLHLHWPSVVARTSENATSTCHVFGAMTFIITTFSIMKLNIIGLIVTLSTKYNQHNNNRHKHEVTLFWVCWVSHFPIAVLSVVAPRLYLPWLLGMAMPQGAKTSDRRFHPTAERQTLPVWMTHYWVTLGAIYTFDLLVRFRNTVQFNWRFSAF